MKNYVITLLLFAFTGSVIFAQKDEPTKKAKDTIRTEVVNVVTSYAPKVTDAFKIKRKPKISLSKNVEKKALEYKIASVPVASTFIPKSGTLKKISLSEKEVFFDNYISLGFGNNITPFFEGYFHKNTSFDSEYGVTLKFLSSSDPVQDTPLSSSFYNIDLDMFYKQIDRYFNWDVGFTAQRDNYNLYGLPTDITFNDNVINFIDPAQTYKDYKLYGGIDFEDSYISNANASVRYFSDSYESSEINATFNTYFSFPLGRFGVNSEDLKLGVHFDYLVGGFQRSYTGIDELNYGFINAGISPSYKYNFYNFDIKIGAKGYFTMDTENETNEFLIYPDVNVSYPIIKKYANIYVGASGDLHNNSFKSLANENYFMSPTATVTQTNEVFNFFGGLKGIMANNLNYNVKASYKNEKAKPFYILNQSKSTGINTTNSTNGFTLTGYDFGNSFDVIYDNVNTVNFTGELEYDFSKKLSLGLNLEVNSYDLKTQEAAWHLPQIKGDIFGVYKVKEWYAGANLYFTGNRKGLIINHTDATTSVVDLNSFIDLNLNGGYHFNPLFSAFLKVNNITNSNYQTFTNFNAQGFQVIGGVIWKFDSLF